MLNSFHKYQRICYLLVIVAVFSTPPLYAKQVSTGKAMLLSAVLPGMGEMYLQEHSKGTVFLGTELLLVVSYLRINQEIKWKTNSYKTYADNYAGISAGQNDNYYRLIHNYFNSETYNAAIERYYRNRYIIYEYKPQLYHDNLNKYLVTGDDVWDWENEKYWLRYREQRRDKQSMEILGNFALGAAVLNRVVSVINSAFIARKINRNSESQSTFLSDLSIEPDFVKNGYRVNYEFKF